MISDTILPKDGLLGQIRYSETKILIASQMSDSKKLDVLSHVVTHGIFYESGYEDQSEEVINRLGKVLSGLLINNDLNFFNDDE